MWDFRVIEPYVDRVADTLLMYSQDGWELIAAMPSRRLFWRTVTIVLRRRFIYERGA